MLPDRLLLLICQLQAEMGNRLQERNQPFRVRRVCKLIQHLFTEIVKIVMARPSLLCWISRYDESLEVSIKGHFVYF